MKLITLDDITYDLKFPVKTVTNKSKGHILAKQILKELYPLEVIYEEPTIKITRNKNLYIDLFIPRLYLAVEVHGEQHYSFNSLFHKNKMQFLQQKNNDRLKKEWCKLNEIALIELPHYENATQWKERILDYEY